MSLKRTSAKLLSWVCGPSFLALEPAAEASLLNPSWSEQQPRRPLHGDSRPYLNFEDVSLFLPELSASGRRSLLSLLIKQNLLERGPSLQGGHGGETLLATQHAFDALEQQFPVFAFLRQPWQGRWTVIAFLESPQADPQFRHLRTKLLAFKAGQVKPGLYLYPGDLPTELMILLKQLYVGSVVVWDMSSWRFGDERRIVSSAFHFSDRIQALSGVSSEIDQLLGVRDPEKGLTQLKKKQLFMVFDRFQSILEEDVGILPFYYPQLPSYRHIFSHFFELYRS